MPARISQTIELSSVAGKSLWVELDRAADAGGDDQVDVYADGHGRLFSVSLDDLTTFAELLLGFVRNHRNDAEDGEQS